MSDQLRYSFKKESAQFFRTFKFLGFILAIFGFAIANPPLYKMSGILFSQLNSNQQTNTMTAAVTTQLSNGDNTIGDMLGGMDINDMASIYSNANSTYALSLYSFSNYSLLVILLVMMSTAGGEQKKRAMIVPQCCGLKTGNYLIPKFVIYPLSAFALTFLGGLTAGGLCNALFDTGKVSFGMMMLGSLFISVYIAFIVTLFLSLGICTSRAGLMVGAVFLGQMFLQNMLEAMGLSDYQPFSLVTVTSQMFNEGYDLSEKTASILVAIGLAIVISVLMFVLAVAVLNAKKIDNQEEVKPEF